MGFQHQYENLIKWGPTVLKWNQQNLFIGQPVFGNSVNALLWNIALGQGLTDSLLTIGHTWMIRRTLVR